MKGPNVPFDYGWYNRLKIRQKSQKRTNAIIQGLLACLALMFGYLLSRV